MPRSLMPLPTATQDDLRQQRDRFVAFAFAAADLVFEIGPDNLIRYAAGAGKELTGRAPDLIVGSSWLKLFAEADRRLVKAAVEGISGQARCGPMIVRMQDSAAANQSAIFNACYLPGDSSVLYCTLTLMRLPLVSPYGSSTSIAVSEPTLFSDAACRALKNADQFDQTLELTLLELVGAQDPNSNLPESDLTGFLDALTMELQGLALAEGLIGSLGKGRYGVIHKPQRDPAAIDQQMRELAKRHASDRPDLAVRSHRVDLNVQELTEEEAAKALVYILKTFAEQGGQDFGLSSLSEGLRAQTRTAAQRIATLKSIIAPAALRFRVPADRRAG